MDFALNEIQQELKTQARLAGERYPLDRDWDESAGRPLGGARRARRWLDVADADLGFVEEALILEEMGYALYPGPYLAPRRAGGGRIERERVRRTAATTVAS